MPPNHSLPLTLQWNRLALDAIKLTQAPLPIAARALAMLHTAMFSAWAVYGDAISTDTGSFIKISGDRSNTKNNKHKAFSFAAYRILRELFKPKLPAAKQDMFRNLMQDLHFDPDDTSLDTSQPHGIGNLAAKLVLEYRNGDGANAAGTLSYPPWSDYTGYNSNNNYNRNFFVPHWGLVKSFALNNNAQYRPPPPYKKGQSKFMEQAAEIIQLSAKLTDEQKVMAEYWNETEGNSVVVHWCEIAQFAANNNGYTNNDCIKLFFAITNAMLDASMACWDCLRFYDAANPVDIIHDIYKNKEIEAWAGPNRETQTMKGGEWQPYIPAPPIPGYVSPQSTISMAAAIILQRYTGSDQFRGYTVVERGDSKIEKGLTPKKDITLEWPTYSEAAREAGISGLYGGIHFAQSVEEGRQLGKVVGECVWNKALFYFND